jgi:hypothetical protein
MRIKCSAENAQLVKPSFAAFGFGRTMDGFEVIALDTGRPLGFEYETAQQANGKAHQLNLIAASGDGRALARALRAG